MTAPEDAAAAIYARIGRRRGKDDLPAAVVVHPAPLPPDRATPPQRVTASSDSRLGQVLHVADVPRAQPSSQGPEADSDTFPRSATMKAILKHPVLALGIGLPAAGLLLSSPGSRRVLAAALRIGTRPELHHLLRLTAAASTPNRPQVGTAAAGGAYAATGAPAPAQKKAP